jgi:hypothetical protein
LAAKSRRSAASTVKQRLQETKYSTQIVPN